MRFPQRLYGILLVAVCTALHLAASQPSSPELASHAPEIGAEVWVAGAKPEQLDRWMKLLADAGMPVARIFISAHEVEPKPGVWDFTLFDQVFDAAQQHGIKVLATLESGVFPAATEAEVEKTRDYIARVVERYKNHPALDTWIIKNEPRFQLESRPLVMQGFREWLFRRYKTIEALNRAWDTGYENFEQIVSADRFLDKKVRRGFEDWSAFNRNYGTRQIAFLAEIVRQHDTIHGLHTNPHALLSNLSESGYDLPAWRSSISSLGVSLHPAWHFGGLRRDQFALGAAYMSDLVRGAVEPKPFWITELQGGNNIYSGTRPLYPDALDITQWLWTGIGSGAQRVVFWLLNTRTSFVEGAEWSMLDFQDRPSERFLAAADVARVMRENAEFFAGARPVEAPITLLLSLETQTMQTKFGEKNAQILELMGFYEILNELGVPVRVKHLHDVNWKTDSDPKQLVILPHLSALDRPQMEQLAAFARRGNTLLATGLTGFYDSHTNTWPMLGFPLEEAFGGNYKEVRYLGDKAAVTLDKPVGILPARQFVGDIDMHSGTALGHDVQRVMALRHEFGKGEILWIPSLIGEGAWFEDRKPLTQWLRSVADDFVKEVPFRFQKPAPEMLLRLLQNGNTYVTIITNGSEDSRNCKLLVPKGLKPKILSGHSGQLTNEAEIRLGGRETLVVMWN